MDRKEGMEENRGSEEMWPDQVLREMGALTKTIIYHRLLSSEQFTEKRELGLRGVLMDIVVIDVISGVTLPTRLVWWI